MKLLIFLAAITCAVATCNIPPRYWCFSRQVARLCGVETACNQWWQTQSTASPVTISLYYESLCPGCREFITTMLYPTWKAFKSTEIMKVEMVPYGNAEEKELDSGLWSYTCQHGPKECTGNLIENCLMKYTDYEFDVYFPIVFCIENATDPIAAAEKCITEGKQDWKAINTCAGNKEGNALMHEAALKTEALEPKHEFVPWIVVNGKHSDKLQEEAQSNLPKLLCELYGGVKPKECQMFLNSNPEFGKQKTFKKI